MRKKTRLLIPLLLFFLTACNQIKEKDFFGEWIINTATFKGHNITMASKTIKVEILPSGFPNKFTVKFNTDSTIDFPGIKTEDIPCKWKINNKKLIICFDTARFRNGALNQIDSLATQTMLNHDPALKKKYLFKRDSILDDKSINIFKVPIGIYTGNYIIQRKGDVLIITSPTTQFELINLDKAFNKTINDMFNGLHK